MKKLLLILLFVGSLFASDYNKALALFDKGDYAGAEKAALECSKKGDKSCDYFLGTLYFGILDEKFTQSSSATNTLELAQAIGEVKKKYQGVAGINSNDPDLAKELYTKSIEYFKKAEGIDKKRDSAIYTMLALLYFRGDTMFGMLPLHSPDYKKTMYYAKLGAKENNPICLNLLGFMYMSGTETLQDFSEAKKYFKLAMAHGNPVAKCNLGSIYYEEGNVEKAKKIIKEGYNEGAAYCGQLWNQYGLGK